MSFSSDIKKELNKNSNLKYKKWINWIFNIKKYKYSKFKGNKVFYRKWL